MMALPTALVKAFIMTAILLLVKYFTCSAFASTSTFASGAISASTSISTFTSISTSAFTSTLLLLPLSPPSLFLKNIKKCKKIEIKKKNTKPIKLYIKHKKIIQSYDNQVKESDLGFVIPLNVDKNIDELHKLIKNYKKNIKKYLINNYFLIDNDKNNFIYQLINGELYVLCLVIKNFFNNFQEKDQLFDQITNNLNE